MAKLQAAQVELAKKAAALKAASPTRISRPDDKTPCAPRRENKDLASAPERIRAADAIRGPPDELVPDPTVFKELNITAMTAWRWDSDSALIALGWPARIKIRRRNFRSRQQLEQFKAALVRKAIEERGRGAAIRC
jgi:hypothetical protein